MRYSTGNPVGPDGSSSPFDLHDNAANIDVWANDRSRMTWPDRLGVSRKTWAGLEQQVTDYLIAQGYESVYLAYGAGVIVERQTQLVQKDGELYRVADAEDLPLTLSGDWTADAAKLQAVGDQALRQLLSSPGGDNLVRHDSSETVNQAIEWRTVATVEKWGAVGDGVTDDSQAFRDMYAETGTLILREGAYKADVLLTGNIVVVGAGNPHISEDKTMLVGGTRIIGKLLIRSNNAYLRNFGVDAGSASGLPVGTEGFVCDAIEYETGVFLDAANITTLGRDSMNTTHGFLFEGYEGFRVSNITVGLRYYGVVCKSRNGRIDGVRHVDIGGCGVFAKSDVPDFAGFVDGTIQNVSINDVAGTTQEGLTDCVGVYVLASSTLLRNVDVSNVRQTFGRAPLAIVGGFGTTYCIGVTFDQIVGDRTNVVVDMGGTLFDINGGLIRGDDYSSGYIFRIGTAVTNWHIGTAVGSITNPAITGTDAFFAFGTGGWDHIQVRNGVLLSGGQVAPHVSGVAPGTISGDVHFLSDGLLAVQDGWATTDAKGRSLNGTVYLSGTVDAATATSQIIASNKLVLPTEIQYYTVPTEKAGVWGSGVVRVWLNGIVLISPAPTSDLKVHLSGISWQIP